MTSSPFLLPILPTRVRRNYRGGLALDRLSGVAQPEDADRPENWIASTLTATNPDFTPEPDEGLTRVLTNGDQSSLKAALVSAPEFYLGAAHVAQLGTQLGFLAKQLDSAMRLHVQVHPTSQFAREKMNAPYGKLEVYYVLAVREGVEGYIRLGFQHSPGRERWREIVEQQDIAAMDACFDRIPVKKGDVWIVPGGLPHAIGEGVLMIEVMEPSDLVVRCEFEREGVVLPPNSRYMGRDLDFCLDVFDYASIDVASVRAQSQLQPEVLAQTEGWNYARLVGRQHTSCFEIFRLQASATGTLPSDGRCSLVIQTEGEGTLHVHGEERLLYEGEACFVAASAEVIRYEPSSAAINELLICRPLLQS
jgi:mannose-6-phosphate isomerase